MRARLIPGMIGVLAGLLVGAPPASAQLGVTYVYTPLDLDKCRHVKGKAEEDYGFWTCTGYAGVVVWVAGGDQRSYVSFGPRARNEVAAQETLASFNSHGKTIEWRLAPGADGKPFPYATILRWNTTVSADTGEPARGQVLVVTRLGPGGVCHVGYVDGRANSDANELARQIADERAREFKCGKDKRIVLGKRGPGFSERYGPE